MHRGPPLPFWHCLSGAVPPRQLLCSGHFLISCGWVCMYSFMALFPFDCHFLPVNTFDLVLERQNPGRTFRNWRRAPVNGQSELNAWQVSSVLLSTSPSGLGGGACGHTHAPGLRQSSASPHATQPTPSSNNPMGHMQSSTEAPPVPSVMWSLVGQFLQNVSSCVCTGRPAQVLTLTRSMTEHQCSWHTLTQDGPSHQRDTLALTLTLYVSA
jgi:hypothetical protein